MKRNCFFSSFTAGAAALLICMGGGGGSLFAEETEAAWEGPRAPEARTTVQPSSALNKATMGSLSGNIDYAMSTTSYGKLEGVDTYFGYAGLGADGLYLGSSLKLNNAFISASYSGSLIDDLRYRLTNGTPDDLTIGIKHGSVPEITDGEGNYLGSVDNKNDINILYGNGKSGFKFGFSQNVSAETHTGFTDGEKSLAEHFTAEGEELSEEALAAIAVTNYNSSLRFSFEAGKKSFVFRIAADLHDYSQKLQDTASPTVKYIEFLSNYIDISPGFTAVKTFGEDASFAVDYDLGARLFNNNGVFGARVKKVIKGEGEEKTETVTTDKVITITNHLVPAFRYERLFDRWMLLGVLAQVDLNVNVDMNMDPFKLDMHPYVSVWPELDVGPCFFIIPDHLSIYAGLGINIYPVRFGKLYQGDDEIYTELKMLSTKIALGGTVQFNEHIIMDLVLTKSGDVDPLTDSRYVDKFSKSGYVDQFTLLFSAKY